MPGDTEQTDQLNNQQGSGTKNIKEEKVEKFTSVSTIVPKENYVILKVRTNLNNYKKVKDKKFYFEVFKPDGNYIKAESTKIQVNGQWVWTAEAHKTNEYIDFYIYGLETFDKNTYKIKTLWTEDDQTNNLLPNNVKEVEFIIK